MVLVCQICSGCGSNQWRTVEGHIKRCAVVQPNVADRVIEPGEPHWRKSDPPLKNHTRAAETGATYTLTVWPDPPNDEDATDQGQIFKCIWKEWTAQVGNIKEAATAEAVEVDKDGVGEVNQGESKWNKPKTK